MKKVNYKEIDLVFHFMCEKKHRRINRKLIKLVTYRDGNKVHRVGIRIRFVRIYLFIQFDF